LLFVYLIFQVSLTKPGIFLKKKGMNLWAVYYTVSVFLVQHWQHLAIQLWVESSES